ncbi:14280_t:CDS:2 [Funneliformis geosporum]|uniref:14280_t:CDS:1 n=1 Tax=Funneliformis geosporum TaxID=1117311 RepID=A0A9W4SXB4_9GLOM|nr:14280_t:CDS:2 [Funneliformis geosporum]
MFENEHLDDDAIALKMTAAITSGVSIPFTSFAPLFASVNEMFNEIIEINQTSEHDKKICGIFVVRVQLADTVVNKFKSLNVIGKIRKFIEEISQLRGLSKHIYAKRTKKCVKELTNELDSIIKNIQLSFNEDLMKYSEDTGSGITNVNQNVSKIVMQINSLNTTLNQLAKKNSTNQPFQLLDFNDFEEVDISRNGKIRKYKRTKNGWNDYVALKLVVEKESITEWADYGNLREYYQKYGPLEIIHHDIRAENILITDNDTAKIANFDASRAIYVEESGNLKSTLEVVRYCSPENLLSKKKYNTKCEVYSFGILLWEIAEEKIPYKKFELAKRATHHDHILRPQLSEISKILQALYEFSRKKPTFGMTATFSYAETSTNLIPFDLFAQNESTTFQNNQSSSQIWIEDSIEKKFI